MSENALRSAVGRLRVGLAKAGPEPTDRQLLDAFLHQHDQDAFAQLVRRHQRLVQSAIAKVLVDPADIEDAFQATFLVLVRKARSLSWRSGLGTWLYAVAHRVAVNAWTAARKRSHREGQAAGRGAGLAAPPDLSWREACALLHAELNKLPEKLRLPLMLCYLEGKSRDEAAELLGATPGGLKSRLERGRKLLRERLARRGVALSVGLLAVVAHSPAGVSSPRLVESTVAAACGAVPVRVAALAQGVTASMILNKVNLGIGALAVAGLFVILLTVRSAPPVGTSDPLPAETAGGMTEIKGLVLGPDGKPVHGAAVRVVACYPKDKRAPGPRAEAVTQADGTFRISGPRGQLDPAEWVVASADGFGCDWIGGWQSRRENLTLQLVKDQAVTGRVIDLEGRPVKGAMARVEMVTGSPNGDLVQFQAEMAKGEHREKSLSGKALPPAAQGTRTDAEGRFLLRGLGAERIASLVVEGPGIVTCEFRVQTRREVVPRLMGNDKQIQPATFTYASPPSIPITGIVRDKETHKPLAGFTVCHTLYGSEEIRLLAEGPWSETKTNAAGRFRLDGLAKNKASHLLIKATAKEPYVPALIPVPDSAGIGPVAIDVELLRGTWIEGRITHQLTGNPPRAQVYYWPMADNPAVVEFAGKIRATLAPLEPAYSNDEGSFRIAALPGKGVVTFRVEGPYLRTAPDKLDRQTGLDTALGTIKPAHYQAVVPVEPGRDGKPVKVDIALVAGEILKGRLVDPDGKPVTGAWTFGLSKLDHGWDGPLKDEHFVATPLDRRRSPRVAFSHPEKNLAGVLEVPQVLDDPVTVTLRPAGTASGRLVDADGKPRAGVSVLMGAILRDKKLAAHMNMAVKTDVEGRFRCAGLVPDFRYKLFTIDDNGAGHLGEVQVASGKVEDLGDVRAVPTQ